MRRVLFEPVDSLFFRDGRSFNMDEPSLTRPGGLFPPNGRTLIGALRAAWARALGWQENQGGWSEAICQQLGSGDDLGSLRFRGPFLLKKASNKQDVDTLLFPAPAHLLGTRRDGASVHQTQAWDVVALAPGEPGEVLESDLNNRAQFPTFNPDQTPEGAKSLTEEGLWVTAEGMSAILKGETPDTEELVFQGELWRLEPRIGIQRSPVTHTVLEGLLYATSHVRLRQNILLALDIRNLPESGMPENALQSRVHPVGGEARMCHLRLAEAGNLPGRPDLPSWQGRLRYTVILLQPADTGRAPQPGEEGYAGLPGTVISACLPKPVTIGGWDSVQRQPRPMRPYLAPGSVLFIETEEQQYEQVKSLPEAIGAQTEWGFGSIVIGCWPTR